jgi:tetratricopeptide (TPR) repeat protein
MQLAEIAALVQTPARASLLLETHFSGDESQAVQDLRERVKAGQELLDAEARNAWQQEYREAQGECSLGRAQDGLRLILDLPAPPRCVTQTEDWPLVSDLHGGLAARLEGELKSFGGIEATASESLAREEELARTVAALEQILANTEGRDDLHDLSERLADMASTLRTRVQDRARALSLRNSKETLAAQDLSLASARARAQAGDLERALEEYERLLASDPSGRIGELFAEEIADVQRRWQAISGARALALEGRHQEALEVLEAELEEAREQPLPWRLTSFPRGALVELPDGSRRATPFLLESRFGETVSLRIECEGCLSLDFELDAPADQHLWLSRTPERSWPGEGRIEALPVAVGEDHIVCDRTGELARLSAEGEELWKVDIASLGGIARAPVFLPRMPGRLLLVTEDGEAWVIDAEDGAIDGPVSLGSAPRSGPVATADGVQVLTREGKLATWTTRLKPSFSPATAADGEALRGSQSGLAARYRSGGVEGVFDSPWNGWRVEFLPEVLRVYKQDDPAGGFAVLRQADWTFLAWEAPHARLPEGRLWISGENGLAGYLP